MNEKRKKEQEDSYRTKYEGRVKILSFDFPTYFNDFLKKNRIELNANASEMNRRYLDWNKYDHYSFLHFYEGAEEEVKELLRKSDLNKTKSVIMDEGYNGPIIQIPTDLFISKWHEFIFSAITGAVIVSEDGRCIMECTDQDYQLISNFKIK